MDRREFYERYNEDLEVLFGDKVSKLCQDGLLVSNGNTISLTDRGLDLANKVFVEFV